jgi:hypothetical protein
MKPILVTPETLAQYKADCKADRDRLKAAIPAPLIFEFIHDTSMVGKVVYVPPSILGIRLTKDELEALRVA